MIVSANCLCSSYYYGALVGFRYSTENKAFDNSKLITVAVFEGIFFIHFILQFFLEYHIEGEKIAIRDPMKICTNYIYEGSFFLDFIVLIPLEYLDLKRKRQDLFYAVKMLRIIKGFVLFDVPDMMAFVKRQYQKKLQVIVDNDPELANDIDQDNTNIG
jgi:hypothetical protein